MNIHGSAVLPAKSEYRLHNAVFAKVLQIGMSRRWGCCGEGMPLNGYFAGLGPIRDSIKSCKLSKNSTTRMATPDDDAGLNVGPGELIRASEVTIVVCLSLLLDRNRVCVLVLK